MIQILTVVATALLTAGLNILVNRYNTRISYRNEYHKKIIEQRIEAYKKVGVLLTMFLYFIGVDISKVTLDICIVNVKGDQIVAYKTANTESSIVDILGVLATNHKATPQNTCFCAEDMRLFGSFLSKVLAAGKYRICFESPLRIKKSIGIQRGKNDAIDALRICPLCLREL